MSIANYLLELLRIHDCVVVPDLGGFVTNYRSADVDLATNSFHPPVKEIIFSGKLTKNDGLLVNYISETEGVGYLEARMIISEFVDETWSRLENGESVLLDRLGKLHFDRNEKLIFEPEVRENLLLDAFGLEAFQFPSLERKESLVAKRIFADRDAVKPVFSSRRVKALLIGVPILLAMVMIPVSKYSLNNLEDVLPKWQVSNTASLPISTPVKINTPVSGSKVEKPLVDSLSKKQTEQIKPATTEQSSSIQKEHPDNVAKTVDPSIAHSSKPQKTDTPSGEAVHINSGRFKIIGGCFKVQENADKFVSQLQAAGFKPEIKTLPNGSFLVIIQSYSNRNDAASALRSLRESEPNAGYWMSAN